MMHITVKEVQELMEDCARVDLGEKPTGYNKEKVDNFLDHVAEELYRVMQYMEDQEKKERMAEAAKPVPAPAPAPVPAPAPAPAVSGSSVEEVLTLAVQLKNSIVAEAQAKADNILTAAQEEAKERLGQLSSEEERLQENVASLKQIAADYRTAFEQLLQAQQEALDKADGLF